MDVCINDIEDKQLRDLAIKRAKFAVGSITYNRWINNNTPIKSMFFFDETPEGFMFWWDVSTGDRKSI